MINTLIKQITNTVGMHYKMKFFHEIVQNVAWSVIKFLHKLLCDPLTY